MMDFETTMNALGIELGKSVKRISKLKSAEERLTESQVTLNLSQSMGVFYKALQGIQMMSEFDDDEDGPLGTDDDDRPEGDNVLPF